MSNNKPANGAQPTQAQSIQLLQQQQQQQLQAQQMVASGQLPNTYLPAQMQQNIFNTFPQLMKLAQNGQLSETQLAQLQGIMRLYGNAHQPEVQHALAALVQTVRSGASAAGITGQASAPMQPSASQQTQPASQPQPQLQGQPTPAAPPATRSQSQQPSQSQQSQVTVSATNAVQHSQSQESVKAPNWAQLPQGAANSGIVTTPAADITSANPGPQSWPNSSGPRPTLTQGLATSSSTLGLPTLVTKPADTLDAIGALNEGFKKDAALSSANDLQMRRTIKDLVASIDPNVKIDSEVEDILLHMADEFIDSVTNFSCRLAKHRGSDTLDVKDLQLHLERNHNIRIPGFSSDETRLAISHANPATGGHGTKAARTTKGDAAGEEKKDGTDTAGGAEEKKKESKKSKAKLREAQSGGAAIRSARLAAIRAMK